MSEGNVNPCSRKRVRGRYRVWLTADSTIVAEHADWTAEHVRWSIHVRPDGGHGAIVRRGSVGGWHGSIDRLSTPARHRRDPRASVHHPCSRKSGNPRAAHSALDIDRVTCAIAHRVTNDGPSDSMVTRILRRPDTTFDWAAVAIRGRWSDGSLTETDGQGASMTRRRRCFKLLKGCARSSRWVHWDGDNA